VLLLLSAAGEPTGRFFEELHLPLQKRLSRNDDLTIAMLVVRVRPHCYFKISKSLDLKSQIEISDLGIKLLSFLFANLLNHHCEIARHRRQYRDETLRLAVD
jgi:hypothetical protein